MKQPSLCFVLLFIFCACQKENVDIPDTGRKIVVNGLISTDSLINVHISRSEYFTDFDTEHHSRDLDSATIRFYNENTCIDSLNHISHKVNYQYVYYKSNYWSKSVRPLPGKEYKISVNRPGFPEAIASTTIPRLVKIERLDTSRINYYDFGFIMNCRIEFTDPPSEKNYYLINIIRVQLVPYLRHYMAFDCHDPVIEQKLGSSSGTSGSDNIVRDHIYGYAFTDKLIEGKKYNLNFSFNGSLYHGYHGSIYNQNPRTSYIYYFRLISITEEYYKFIQSFQLFNSVRWNPLAEPVQVYSNINGGYGIFAGAAVSTDSIILHD